MTADTSPSIKRRSKANWFWLAAWPVMLAAVVALVFKIRDTTLAQMDTPEARAQWDAWRAAPPNQTSSGPVDRKPPRANTMFQVDQSVPGGLKAVGPQFTSDAAKAFTFRF